MQTAPYEQLTETRADVTNLWPDPSTGMARDSDGRLYAVNPYASLVNIYDDTSLNPIGIITTGLNPVSVAVWEPDAQTHHVLVICQGTHALFVHEMTGEIVDVVQLDSEPTDIVIDETNEIAYVSCRGRNSVLQIDLTDYTWNDPADRYQLSDITGPENRSGERPGPLVFDDVMGLVWVAQTVTGNNTIPQPGGQTAAVSIGIVNLDGAAPNLQLQDQDIYCIDPTTQTVHAVVRGAGSLIFDIERATDPVTQAELLYILSTDSKNDLFLDEPSMRGKFVANQLIVVDVTGYTPGDPPIQAPAGIDLDLDPAPGPGQDPYRHDYSIGQADSIEVFSGGTVLISSPVQDRVIELDRTGQTRVNTYDLNANAQVYDLALLELSAGDPFDGFFALGLGNMQVEVFLRGTPNSPIAYNLGFDPTPDQIRRGRDTFLDGSLSLDGRVTCMSCHPQGNSDQLGWELSGVPFDIKEVMVTQSLLSIADTFPHHWRGERDLPDFGKAWDGLLGDVELIGADLNDVVAFMNSLQAPANPIQNPERLIDDTRIHPTTEAVFGATSAVTGQMAFLGDHPDDVITESFNQQQCVECHPFPTGSNGDQFTETSANAPTAMNIEVAHLRQLQHKGEEVHPDLRFQASPVVFTNENGFGVTHAGAFSTVFGFHAIEAFNDINDLQARIDIAEFVRQWDQGIAPAAHRAIPYLLPHVGLNETSIENVLLNGAGRGNSNDWIDVVAFGRYRVDEVTPSPWLQVRWLYDPDTDDFTSDTPSVGPFSWATFQTETAATRLETVVLGVPRGAGRVYGVDFDNDGLLNGDDPNPATPGSPPDTTPPTLLSHSVDFTTARVAKYQLEFSEPVTYEITYTFGRPQKFRREYEVQEDSAVLTFIYHPNACDSFPCDDLNDTDVPPLPGEEPTPESSFTVVPTITYRDGVHADVTETLTGFTPTLSQPMFTGDSPGDDTAEAAFKYLNFTRWGPTIMNGSTFTGTVEIRVREDSNAGLHPNVQGDSVVILVGVQRPVDDHFKPELVSGAAPFLVDDGAGGTEAHLGILHDVVLAGPTDNLGKASVTFDITNLPSGSKVRAATMAIATPSGLAFDPLSLILMKPLRLEDAMITPVFTVP
jgi:hypothetical protein